MNIPLLDLKREYEFLRPDIDRQLKQVIDSQAWILGSKVTELEKKVSKYLNSRYTVGVASGTDALVLSLHALALKAKGKVFFDKKDEIITTPFTFVATAEAIIRAGAKPVFVDIDAHTYNISPEQVEKAVTRNTVGIMPVHLYGLACDMAKIKKIARQNKLFIVEDTAQGFGAEYKSKKLGSIGDTGAFSFFPSKNLGGWGDGGMVVTNHKTIADNIRILRNHGQKAKYKADMLGYNSRLDSIQAAVLLAKLKHIDKFNKTRIRIAKKYNQAFSSIKQLQIPFLQSANLACRQAGSIGHSVNKNISNSMRYAPCAMPYSHIYHLYTIKVDKGRDKLLKYLNHREILARVYYPVPLNKMKAFESAKVKGGLLNAEKASKQVLSLPIHPFMRKEEVEYVINTVRSFFSS